MPAVRSFHELINRCIEGDQTCWEELWRLIKVDVSDGIRRVRRDYHLGQQFDEDLRQSFYIYLRDRGIARLQAFHGTGESQFHAYVRTVVAHFAHDWLANWQRDFQREALALRTVARPVHVAEFEGRTLEASVAGVVADLPPRDRLHLLRLLGCADGMTTSEAHVGAFAPRTGRRWKQDLCRRLRELL